MILKIEGIECYAFHGCLKEETVIGQLYHVDVIIDGDFSKAVATDNLEDAADYCTIYHVVKKEMAIPSKLIEHVAGRILNNIRQQLPSSTNILIRLHKHMPPVNGIISAAVFEISG